MRENSNSASTATSKQARKYTPHAQGCLSNRWGLELLEDSEAKSIEMANEWTAGVIYLSGYLTRKHDT